MRGATASIIAAMCLLATPISAHHSFSMFDYSKTTTYKEVTVKEFEWSAPHAWLYVLIQEADGQVYEWGFEMGSPGQITTGGWKRDSVKPGDKMTIVIAPMKDGSRSGALRSAVLPNGQNVTGNGTRVNDTGQPAR